VSRPILRKKPIKTKSAAAPVAPPPPAPPPPAVAPIALTIRQACLAVGVSRSTLAIVVGRGDLKVKKLGAKVLIRLSDLEAWLENLPSPAA
jgi:excisionase family DNA binding protein